jgi:outer membrane protein assembly factor BamA
MHPVRRLVIGTLLALCAFADARPVLAQPVIREIRIRRSTVFDTPTRNFLESAANSLHWPTIDATVRQELLFKEGDRLDQDLIDETERNLRALPFLTGAWIQVVRKGKDTVDLVVRTRDKWSLGGRFSYRQGGGMSANGGGGTKGNMFGKGQSLGLGYAYLQEDRTSHGMSFEIADRRLFSSRWSASLRHSNGRDLTTTSLHVERPFFSDAATWAAGAVLDFSRERLRFYDNSVLMRDANRSQDRQGAWISVSNGQPLRLYAGLGYLRARSDADPSFLQTIDNLDIATVSFGVMRRDFYEGAYLDNLGRIEDVPVGFHLNLSTGIGRDAVNTDRALLHFRALWQHTQKLGPMYYLGYEVSGSTFFQGRTTTDTRFNARIVQHLQPHRQHTIIAQLETMIGSNWPENIQPSLASTSGLRGYNNFTLAGHRRVTGTIEYRFTPDITLWILRLGAAVFHDAGAAWDDADRWDSARFRHTTGFGLRIESTIRGGSDLVRIDFPFTHDGKVFTQVIISGSQLLSAFLDMPILGPLDFH